MRNISKHCQSYSRYVNKFLVSKETVVLRIVRSDEGLTLETSAFEIFHGGNFTFINSFDKSKFLFLFKVRPNFIRE